MMFVGCPVPNIQAADMNESVVLSLFKHALGESAGTEVRKERQYIKANHFGRASPRPSSRSRQNTATTHSSPSRMFDGRVLREAAYRSNKAYWTYFHGRGQRETWRCRNVKPRLLPIALQSLRQAAIDLTRLLKTLLPLERSYRTARFRAHHPIDAAVIIPAPCEGCLDCARGIELVTAVAVTRGVG